MTFDEASKLIKKGDIIRLRKELQDGLSPNLANQYSWTLLMIAALEGNTSIGSLLIESGAELDSRNKSHATALSWAAHTGHSSFVSPLLEIRSMPGWIGRASTRGAPKRFENSLIRSGKPEPRETMP